MLFRTLRVDEDHIVVFGRDPVFGQNLVERAQCQFALFFKIDLGLDVGMAGRLQKAGGFAVVAGQVERDRLAVLIADERLDRDEILKLGDALAQTVERLVQGVDTDRTGYTGTRELGNLAPVMSPYLDDTAGHSLESRFDDF